MALFVPLDASYDHDPKILDLDDERSELLFIRSLAYSKRHLLDGQIHRRALHQIAPFAGEVDPLTLAADLVRHGLWTVTEKGWRITSWLKRNPASETILTPSRGLEMAHQRHHVKRGVVKEGCPLCLPVDNADPQVTTHDACADAVRDAQHAMPEPESVPEPEPSTSSLRTTPVAPATEPSHDDEQAAADLEQTVRRTAALVGRAIAANRPGIDNPTGYAQGATRQILDPTGDGIDRARITRELADGRTPEAIAADWCQPQPDPLLGTYPASDQPPDTRPPLKPFDLAAHEAEAEAQRAALDAMEAHA